MLENLDPRKHISASIGWAVFIIIALAAPLCAWLVAKETESFFRESASQSLQQYATQVHREITTSVQSRLSVIQLAAAQLAPMTDSPAELREALDIIHREYPEINWIGVANAQGEVIAATGNILLGENVAALPWFANGTIGPYLGDVYNAELMQKYLPNQNSGSSFRVVDVAAPLKSLSGESLGVIGGHLSWNWIRNLQALSLSAVDPSAPQLEFILAAEDGIVWSGPADLIDKPVPSARELTQKGKYLIGAQRSAYGDAVHLDWTVALRGESAQAISAGRSAQKMVILTVMAAGSLAAILIMIAVSKLTRRLRELSKDAEKITRGEKQMLNQVEGTDDVSQIGRVLATSISNLHQEKQTLQALNQELDQRVDERTNEIKRLSAESREVALTQQRLRFARDMHDTLAHSMMAVLTQIRLIRKIRNRMTDSEIEEELGRAESVALNGLTEARAAITQVRTNNVQDKGLLVSLHELAERFRARSGLLFHIQIDPQSMHQEDQRAETVYRVVEEALRNIEKHANANEVHINLHREPSDDSTFSLFKLSVVDDGRGFDPDQVAAGHYGLIGLQEQALLIDGDLKIESKPGSGTTVSLTYSAYSM